MTHLIMMKTVIRRFIFVITACLLFVSVSCTKDDDPPSEDLRDAFVGTYDVSETIIQPNSISNFYYTLSINKISSSSNGLWLHNIGATGRSLETRVSDSSFYIDRQALSTSVSDFEVESIAAGSVSASGDLQFSYLVITAIGDRIAVEAVGKRR